MRYRIETIVAGVGTPDADDPALRRALALARDAGAALHLVHAFDFPRFFTLEPGAGEMYPDAATGVAAELEARMRTAVRALPGGEDVACEAWPGSPAEAIRRAARRTHAHLVVVGASGAGRIGRAVLGTTAQRVLREVGVPVLVTRSAAAAPPERVLLTTDLTELSGRVHERAMDVVEELFGPRHRSVRSLLVLAFDVVPPPLSEETLRRSAQAELDAFLAERAERTTRVEGVLRTGAAAAEVVREAAAWPAELLVVGTHARHGIQRLLLGSVAEACLRDAPCDVLAIPPDPRAGEAETDRPAPEALAVPA